MSQLLSKKRLMVPTSLHLVSMQEDTPAPGESCGCSEWVLIHMARTLRRAMVRIQGILQEALKHEHLTLGLEVCQPDLGWSFTGSRADFSRRDRPPKDPGTCLLGFTLTPGPELPLRSLYKRWPASVRRCLHIHPDTMMLKELRIAKARGRRAIEERQNNGCLVESYSGLRKYLTCLLF